MKLHKKITMAAAFAGMLGLTSFTYAMHEFIRLPDAEVLTERLKQEKFDHLLQNTSIIEQLAGKNSSPVGVQMIIRLLIDEHAQQIERRSPVFAMVLKARQIPLIKLVLQDHQQGIAELEAAGLLR